MQLSCITTIVLAIVVSVPSVQALPGSTSYGSPASVQPATAATYAAPANAATYAAPANAATQAAATYAAPTYPTVPTTSATQAAATYAAPTYSTVPTTSATLAAATYAAPTYPLSSTTQNPAYAASQMSSSTYPTLLANALASTTNMQDFLNLIGEMSDALCEQYLLDPNTNPTLKMALAEVCSCEDIAIGPNGVAFTAGTSMGSTDSTSAGYGTGSTASTSAGYGTGSTAATSAGYNAGTSNNTYTAPTAGYSTAPAVPSGNTASVVPQTIAATVASGSQWQPSFMLSVMAISAALFF